MSRDRAVRRERVPVRDPAPGGDPRDVVLVAHPFADRYGSDRMVLESVRALVEDGRRVVVTLPEDGPLVGMVTDAGAEVRPCPTPRLSKALLRPRGLVTLVRDTVRGTRAGAALLREVRPVAAYVNTVTVPWWVVLCRLHGVPVLVHVHEAERSASWWLRTALAAPLVLAHAVAANSRFAIDTLADSFPRLARRTHLLPNGVAGPPTREPVRTELAPPVRLVYVGRLSARKGVDLAVEAVGRLRGSGHDVRLDVVGAVFPGYEWYADDLARLVDRLGLGDHVTFHGFQDPVWPYYAAADVVLVPSRTDEPFGNTAVEALLTARPVVAGGSGGLVEATAGFGAARVVPPGDADALADAVAGLLASWPDVAAQAWDDAAAAEQRHAPAAYRARVVALVRDLARPRRGRVR